MLAADISRRKCRTVAGLPRMFGLSAAITTHGGSRIKLHGPQRMSASAFAVAVAVLRTSDRAIRALRLG